MSLNTFRESILKIAVPWLIDEVGEPLLWAIGMMPDALTEWIRQGVRARFPGVGTSTALPFIGSDRQIERGPREPDGSYSDRLRRAFDTWQIAGNAHSILPQLRAFFLPDLIPIRLVTDSSVWHEIDPDTAAITKTKVSPPNWIWDEHSKNATPVLDIPRWFRAWAIIDSSNGPWRQWEIGEPNVAIGGGNTIGSTATVGEVEGVRRILRNFKAANEHFVHVIVTFDPSVYERTDAPGAPMPAQDHDQYSARSTSAAFWKGVST